MYTIENHLLHLNMGAGGSRAASQGVVGQPHPDYPLQLDADGDIYHIRKLQGVVGMAAASGSTGCIVIL